jgi:putative NADH-flavin reductase
MNLTVLGATGPTGTQLVEQALAAGHQVTALARSGQKVTITNPNLHVVEGDATDRAVVSQAVKGNDAVISVLGARGPGDRRGVSRHYGRGQAGGSRSHRDVVLLRRRA